MAATLRREEKYLLYQDEASNYINQFEQLLMNDDFSEKGSYMVRSLYFDTATNCDYFDIVNDKNLRHKIRLRIYDSSDITAKLEIIKAEGVYQKKCSLIVSKHDALELIKGNYSVLLNYEDNLADELYSTMIMGFYRPTIIIDFQRKAFIAKENNIRLTFDSEMQATESSFDLFNKDLLLYPIGESSTVVFGIKYDQFMLSYISDIISVINKRPVAFSKYITARSLNHSGYIR